MSDRTQSLAARNAANPFSNDGPTKQVSGAFANAEQQRAVAEVQARMIIARSNPRDQMRCMDAILRDCTRPTLAASALYQYAKGGTSISGASIRLAEAIAQRWGNIASGIKEVSRSGGYSECIAYAWDLETGFYDERQFQVRHWRDTRQGGHAITDEREIYELIANMGQRRKRAVLLTVIPGDVTEAAVEECERTLAADANTSPEALKKLVGAFASFKVSQAQIEKRCQCRLASIRPAQIMQLSRIYTSIKDEMSTTSDWFETDAAPVEQQEQRRPSPATPTVAPVTEAAAAPDIWAVDEYGEPTNDGEAMTPIDFAWWFTRAYAKSANRDALREHNDDAIGDAGVDPVARKMIQDAIEQANPKATAGAGAQTQKAAADGDAVAQAGGRAATPPPAVPALIELPRTAKGAVHWPNFGAACNAALAKLNTESEVEAWCAMHRPLYVKMTSEEFRIERYVKERLAAIAAPVATADDDGWPGPKQDDIEAMRGSVG